MTEHYVYTEYMTQDVFTTERMLNSMEKKTH